MLLTLDHLDDLCVRLAADLGPDARLSVWVGEPGGPPSYGWEAEAQHYAASTMKLPLVLAAHRLAGRGVLGLDDPVEVHDTFRSAHDGSPFTMRQSYDQDDAVWARLGATMTVAELARHAIVTSSNLATNLLLEKVGSAEVAAVLADAGCSSRTVLPRGIEDAAARTAGLENLVTVADLARLVATVPPAVESLLAAQQHRDQLPAGLPAGTYVAHKTGHVDGVALDVGLVRPDHRPPYAVALAVTADAPLPDLYAANAQVSAAIWAGWTA